MSDVERRHDPHALYGGESPYDRYRRLTVGPHGSRADLLLHEVVLGLATGMPGAAGIWLRSRLYAASFAGFDRRAYLGRNVLLRCPRHITLAQGVFVEDYAQLVATSIAQPAISLAQGAFVRSFAVLNAGPPDGHITIGARSGVGQGTIIYGNGGVSIGADVMIAGQCFIVASSHLAERQDIPMMAQGFSARGITIGDNVWIGAGAKILDGVTIGTGAIVGANAVVTRSVPARARVAGIPARPLPDRA